MSLSMTLSAPIESAAFGAFPRQQRGAGTT